MSKLYAGRIEVEISAPDRKLVADLKHELAEVISKATTKLVEKNRKSLVLFTTRISAVVEEHRTVDTTAKYVAEHLGE